MSECPSINRMIRMSRRLHLTRLFGACYLEVAELSMQVIQILHNPLSYAELNPARSAADDKVCLGVR